MYGQQRWFSIAEELLLKLVINQMLNTTYIIIARYFIQIS